MAACSNRSWDQDYILLGHGGGGHPMPKAVSRTRGFVTGCPGKRGLLLVVPTRAQPPSIPPRGCPYAVGQAKAPAASRREPQNWCPLPHRDHQRTVQQEHHQYTEKPQWLLQLQPPGSHNRPKSQQQRSGGLSWFNLGQQLGTTQPLALAKGRESEKN